MIYGFDNQKSISVETSFLYDKEKITVIIAARNEEANIEKCLYSILNQSFDKSSYEIIVVDDHSTDRTLSILERLSEEYDNLRYYSLENSFSKKEAVKLGVLKANNNIIATTDADCEVSKNWLKYIAVQFQESSLLIAPVQIIHSKGFLSVFQEFDMYALQGVTFGSISYRNPLLINAANMAFQKKDYLKLCSNINRNTPSGDDMFLMEEIKKNKNNIKGILDENVIVKTKAENSWIDFFYQRIRWASKSKHYEDKWIKYFGIMIFLINVCLIFIYFHLVFVEQNRDVYIILLLTKWLIDFILLFLVSSFYKRRRILTYFLPVQIVYPFYVMVIGLLSSFFKIRWKDRIYNG